MLDLFVLFVADDGHVTQTSFVLIEEHLGFRYRSFIYVNARTHMLEKEIDEKQCNYYWT